MRRQAWLVATVLASTPASAQEQKAQPPPQFTSGYEMPQTRAPQPRPELFNLVDIGILSVVIALGAWLVFVRRSRAELRILAAFSVLYFGFLKLGCVCAVGSVQNIAYASRHSDYRLPLVVAAFFALPLVASLFFGRVFCGSACPMGALQDLLLIRARKVPAWLSGTLGTIPYLYLGAAVAFAWMGSAFVVCEYDPFITIFRLEGHLAAVLLSGAFIVLSTFVGRPYCRFLCPYSVPLRWAGSVAKYRIRITPGDCVNCHLCSDACPHDAILPPTAGTIDRHIERRRTLRILLATVALAGTFAFAGYRLAPIVARWDLRVARAWELRQEQENPALAKTTTTDSWIRGKRPIEDAYREAAAVERAAAVAIPLLGLYSGFVIGLRALFLTIRRKRDEYETDASACVSCARCYPACPIPNRSRYAGMDNLLEAHP